jgi:putative hydrolase of the HAD superfamily
MTSVSEPPEGEGTGRARWGVHAPAALLFDLDNTLTTRRASVENFAAIFADDHRTRLHAIELSDLQRILVELDQGGYNPRRAEQLRERLPWKTVPSVDLIETHWQRRFADAVVPRPGLRETLERLAGAGLSLGVVTNGGVVGQQSKIDRLGIRELLRSVIVSEAVGCKKPDPLIFQLACREVGSAPGECWFVGDHPANDVLGAENIGMRAVWIADEVTGHQWPTTLGEAPAALARIESLEELPALLSVGGVLT